MEYILQNTLLALLEYPESTLLDVNRMLTNKSFRAAVVEKITDPIIKSFWSEEFASFTDSYAREATPAIQNKIGQFTSNPLIRNIVGQPRSSFDLRRMMDEKKIFIVNLSKGRMGETNAALLGSMLVVKIYLAAMSRADEPAARLAQLPRCYFYVDEFQSMMNEAFSDILSESRKYKLALTLANQYIEQMEEEVRDAVFGNVGTLIVFRVGPFDAEVLETVFDPTFLAQDLVGLGIGQIYLTLMIDGVGSAPFSAQTIPPIEAPLISYRDDCVRYSRAQYSRPRAEIESLVNQRQKDFAPPPKQAQDRHRDFGNFEKRSTMGLHPRNNDRAGSGSNSRMNYQVQPQRSDRQFHVEPRVTTPVNNVVRENPASPIREDRGALRAAISAARPPVASSGNIANTRSPADILRERLAHKTMPERPVHRTMPGDQTQKSGNSGFAAASRVEEKENIRPSSHEGEISNEELRRVLNVDERGH